MVNVRNHNNSHRFISGGATAGGHASSLSDNSKRPTRRLFSIRNALLLYIVYQSYRIVQKIATKNSTTIVTTKTAPSLTEVLHKTRLQKQQQQQREQRDSGTGKKQQPANKKTSNRSKKAKRLAGVKQDDKNDDEEENENHPAVYVGPVLSVEVDQDDAAANDKPNDEGMPQEDEEKEDSGGDSNNKEEEGGSPDGAVVVVEEEEEEVEEGDAEENEEGKGDAQNDTNDKEEEDEETEKDGRGEEEDENEDNDDENEAAATKKGNKELPDVLTKHGSGPARLGYVVDLVQERDHRTLLRQQQQSLVSSLSAFDRQRAADVTRQLGGDGGSSAWTSCEYIGSKKNKGIALLQHSNCRDGDIVLAAYNPAPFSRYVCGQEIAPGTAVKLEHHGDDCTGSVHLFPLDHSPTVHGTGMPPIVVTSKPASTVPDDRILSLEEIPNCNIPCKFETGLLHFKGAGSTLHVNNWTVLQSKEDPYYRPDVKMERTDFRRDHYYSTTSLLSSVPLSFYDSKKYGNYFRDAKAVSWKTAKNRATYLLDSDCQSGRRHKWLAAVKAAMEVESYGSCAHNTDLLAPSESLATLKGRIGLMKKNRIVLAFEAGNERDHITNIVWEALLSGAVPAIYGPGNLEQRLPPNSAILSAKFNGWDKFASYVRQVSENRTMWESFHEWRTDDKALASFASSMKFTDTPETCRLCRWAYAKQYGLGWNHTQQDLQEPKLPRELCIGSKGDKLITKPFREQWKVGGTGSPRRKGRAMQSSTCTASSDVTMLDLKNGVRVQRRVTEHDGIVDLTLERIENGDKVDVVLRLEFPGVRNTDGAHFRDTHTLVQDAVRTAAVSSASIQDDKVKVTVLANWPTATIRSPEEGVVELTIGSITDDDEIRRIRIITEDMSELHDKMTEYFPSTFGKLMIRDFIDPLELYYEA
jgi:Glycosyltransferase family 10 (fucosyltransferase) C-term